MQDFSKNTSTKNRDKNIFATTLRKERYPKLPQFTPCKLNNGQKQRLCKNKQVPKNK